MKKLVIGTAFVTLLAVEFAIAQTPRRPDSAAGRSTRSSTPSRSSWSRGGPSGSTSVATTRSRPTSTSSAGNTAGAGLSTTRGSSPNDRGTVLSWYLRQRYRNCPMYNYNPNDLFRVDSFFRRLQFEYGFWSADYLGVYAQGVPTLNGQVVNLALQNSSQASQNILQLSADMEELLVRYRQGELSKAEFEEQFRGHARHIKQLAKRIRKDDYVRFVDPRKDLKSSKVATVRSLPELQALIDQLRQTTVDMQQNMSTFDDDQTTVVSIGHLRQPSFRSLSRKISTLADAISRSARRL